MVEKIEGSGQPKRSPCGNTNPFLPFLPRSQAPPSFLPFPNPFLKMMIDLTPRIEAALNVMNHDELQAVYTATIANNEETVRSLLAAKDLQVMLESDPLMKLMYHPELRWGDLMLAMPVPKAIKYADEEDMDPDAEWAMPVLRLRKHIWENFPVVVIPMQTKDNQERYAVRWHHKNFQEAREACEHGWQYMDYEEDTYRRLMKSLSASRFWTVEEARETNDLCVIAMNFVASEDSNTKPVRAFKLPSSDVNDSDTASVASMSSSEWETVGSKKTASLPVLRRLNDVKTHFPVIWNEVPNKKNTTYAVEIFGKKVKELGLNAIKVKTDLLAALKASKSWTVLPGTSDRVVCLLQMNHA